MKSKAIVVAIVIVITALISLSYDHVSGKDPAQLKEIFILFAVAPVIAFAVWARARMLTDFSPETIHRDQKGAKEFRRKLDAERAAQSREDHL